MVDKEKLRAFFSQHPEKYYEVEILKEFGFKRRKCPKCGTYFWSIEKESCGDTLCEGGYSFIGEKRFDWDFLETIERWERFFEKNGHKVIAPYPVVARWRNDLFFTIASIADFQPWVLRGEAEPPGNPLVVAQPCLRFNDVENVGLTNRHLTLFFMGGQHAFGLENYWRNETIGFGFRFLTEVLKIPPEEITYREDVWAGGGNFGPSLEAFAYGLEIVNHVFMQFEELEQGYREMSMKVVDTGWGLERVAWFVNGAISMYEVVFPMAKKLREELGLGIDEDFMKKFARLSGLLNFEEANLEESFKLIEKATGLSYKQIWEKIAPLRALYAILDHTRALAFALADGALPSNVGGGYNLRSILRRAWALNERFKFDLDFAWLIREHARYFAKKIPRLKKLPDVEDILEVERQRYEKSRKLGKEVVVKLIKKGEKLEDKLLMLYESYGIDPESVKSIAKELGYELEVPPDFYAKLSSKKGTRKAEKPARDLPETTPLYYELPPDAEFEAKVIWADENEVVLDKTLFYPGTGGQACDTGYLIYNNKRIRVKRVWKEGRAIVHEVEEPIPVGAAVKGKIDVARRLALMRHHTATHIINGAARAVLGKHVWQAGAEKKPEMAHLDITHYKALSKEELRKIEKLANEIVLKNLRIEKLELPRTEAEQRFGFVIYQGGAVPGKKLRIVNIPGFDVEACGGTHADFTGEVGLIKILRAKRIQDGVVRLEFVAGLRSLEEFWRLEDLLEEASKAAETSREDLVKGIEKLKKRIKELSRVKGKDVEFRRHGNVLWAFTELPYKLMEKVAEKKFEQEKPELLIIGNKEGGILVLSQGRISAVEIAKKIAQEIGGNAGGNEKLARGGGKQAEKLEEVIKRVLNEI